MERTFRFVPLQKSLTGFLNRTNTVQIHIFTNVYFTAGLPGMAHVIVWPMDSHQAPYTYFIAYTGEYPISHIKILCSNWLCI